MAHDDGRIDRHVENISLIRLKRGRGETDRRLGDARYEFARSRKCLIGEDERDAGPCVQVTSEDGDKRTAGLRTETGFKTCDHWRLETGRKQQRRLFDQICIYLFSSLQKFSLACTTRYVQTLKNETRITIATLFKPCTNFNSPIEVLLGTQNVINQFNIPKKDNKDINNKKTRE